MTPVSTGSGTELMCDELGARGCQDIPKKKCLSDTRPSTAHRGRGAQAGLPGDRGKGRPGQGNSTCKGTEAQNGMGWGQGTERLGGASRQGGSSCAKSLGMTLPSHKYPGAAVAIHDSPPSPVPTIEE